jgi:hypothetical protein
MRQRLEMSHVLRISSHPFDFPSVEGIDFEELECVFSPAKRRGPVPGRVGQARKANEAIERSKDASIGMGMDGANLLHQHALSGGGGLDEMAMHQMLMQQQGMGASEFAALAGADSSLLSGGSASSQLQQLSYLQQLGGGAQVMAGVTQEDEYDVDQGPARRVKTEIEDNGVVAPDTVAAHMRLLSRDSIDGNRLRAFYRLSVDELFALPPIPTNQEYCERNDISESLVPGSHKFALNASRFGEVALGAIVHNEVSLAMELCNAVVHCLRECTKDPVKSEYGYEVARAYFLLGTFRAFRGDMVRYFKYRRVCMQHLSKLDVSQMQYIVYRVFLRGL